MAAGEQFSFRKLTRRHAIKLSPPEGASVEDCSLVVDSVSEYTELTYAKIDLKSTKEQKKKKENKENKTESPDFYIYSNLTLKTDQGDGYSEVTYAQWAALVLKSIDHFELPKNISSPPEPLD
ncbi:hypothetical protein ROHU_021256 [Labeo rohita]|uniref:Uncharacterized protein n=1 Tax=Labeo rohita TaxID=84645 RepID=A0A498MV60_LABRO|nr:hypothetical protein ROHU_021256 [Labeo rohita]